jgi:hypothetical protein
MLLNADPSSNIIVVDLLLEGSHKAFYGLAWNLGPEEFSWWTLVINLHVSFHVSGLWDRIWETRSVMEGAEKSLVVGPGRNPGVE